VVVCGYKNPALTAQQNCAVRAGFIPSILSGRAAVPPHLSSAKRQSLLPTHVDIGYPLVTEEAGFPLAQEPSCLPGADSPRPNPQSTCLGTKAVDIAVVKLWERVYSWRFFCQGLAFLGVFTRLEPVYLVFRQGVSVSGKPIVQFRAEEQSSKFAVFRLRSRSIGRG